MNQLLGTIEIKLLSETIFGGDGVQRETVDIDLQSDEYGLPFLSGRTLKGLLRREAQWYVNQLPPSHQEAYEKALGQLFGEADEGVEHRENYQALKFGIAKLSDEIYKLIERENLPSRNVFDAVTLVRSMTSIDNETGTAQDGSLRQARVMQRDYSLFAPIFVNRKLSKEEKDLLETSVKLLRHLGMMRKRGKGQVQCQVHWHDSSASNDNKKVANKPIDSEVKYILLHIENEEALKINDVLRTSDSTRSLNYIPGHVLRGALVHSYLMDQGLEEDELATEAIFHDEDMQFWNAYLQINRQRSIPFPVHLYETKEQARRDLADHEERRVYNDLTEDIEEIEKEAPVRIGEEMMMIDGERLLASNVEKTSNLHLSLNGPKDDDQVSKLYRYESIAPNQTFQAVIKVEKMNEFTKWLLEKEEMYLWLGGARNSGYGRSRVRISTLKENPEQLTPIDEATDELYIIATSHWILRKEDGQLTHVLDEDFLSEELGAKLTLDQYIVNSSLTGGYVSHWQAYHPIIRAVKAGSVFRYKVEGRLDRERIDTLVNKGVGQRRNEGFGRLTIFTSWPYKTLTKPKEVKATYETVERKHVSKETEREALQRFTHEFVQQDLTYIMHEKVNEWYESILHNFRQQVTFGGVKSDLSATKIGNLLEVTSGLKHKIKKADCAKTEYQKVWNRFWEGYDSRQSNKEKLNYELIYITDESFGKVRLREFILEKLPKFQWRSNYFQDAMTEASKVEWDVRALQLLLRRMVRDQRAITK
ncbi:MAG TPA: RAMP superfamily CRISPR-associated protein [Pseudogracilibacillus sp.]|nr:RAMP superfamily CRISPR-associated protein [Pseudogracilibacillus sp.]